MILDDYMITWKMKFNLERCKVTHFGEKKKKNNSQFYISMTDLSRLVLIRNKILGLSYKLSVKVAV